MKPQHGLSTAEAINRLIQFGQLNYEHKKELGEISCGKMALLSSHSLMLD